MKFKWFLSFAMLFTTAMGNLLAAKVGLLIVATGKYDQFVEPLIQSARKHFCANEEVTYFVFADGNIPHAEDIVHVFQNKLGWPYDTMMRNAIYHQHKELFAAQDYLFALDADMLFVDEVGSEILGDRVATLHPGYYETRGTYETDPLSLAYVDDDEGDYYFAGGFFGGAREEFLKIISETTWRVLDDLSRNIIAVWHDESHWNRYCIDHPPTVILSPSYCSPDGLEVDYPKKLIALDKDHDEVRSDDI